MATKLNLRLSVAAAALLPLAPLSALAAPASNAGDDEDLIVVTGSPLADTIGENFGAISVLQDEALARQSGASLGDALASEPGVSSSYFGAGASRPIIRGQGGARVRVLDNGIGSIDAAASSPDHATSVTPAMAERIEVLRGTGLLRYGSSAAGGAVNVIDGRMPTEAPEDGIEGALRITDTSVDEGTEASAGLTATLKETDAFSIVGHLSGTWRDASDFDIPDYAESAALRALEEAEHDDEDEDEDHDHEEGEEEEIRGTLPNSFVETDSISAGLSFIGERGFLSFGVKSTSSTYGLPGGHEHGHEEEHEDEDHDEDHDDDDDHDEDEDHGHEEGEEEEEENVFIDLDQTRYDVKAAIKFVDAPFEMLTIDAGYADYTHTEFEGPGEAGTVFSNEGYEARVELVQTERNGWTGVIGGQLREREFSAIGEEAFVPPTETTQHGLFTFQRIARDAWGLEGALRLENTEHERTTDGETVSFDTVSVSAGGKYDVSDLVTLSGTVFRTERAPVTEELFADGPHLATGQFEIGDPTLDVETATGIEAIARLANERGRLSLTLFQTSYDDFIYETETGEEEDELPVYQFVSEDAVFTGLEIEGQFNIGTVGGADVSVDGVFDLVQAELDVDGNDNLPRIPPKSATIGVDAEWSRLSLRGEVEHAADQTSVSQFELETDGYTLLNAYAEWQPFAEAEGLNVSVGVHNLTDEDAREHTSFLKDEVPLPGRNVRISLGYTF